MYGITDYLKEEAIKKLSVQFVKILKKSYSNIVL